MQIKPVISLGEILTFAGLVFASFSVLLNFYQTRRNTITSRAHFTLELYKTYLFESPDLTEIYYQIEYGTFRYKADFHGSPTEKSLDKLLGLFDMIATLQTAGVLAYQDLRIFEYEFVTLYRDKNLQEYLSFIDSLSRSKKIVGPKFLAFRMAAEKFSLRKSL